MIFAGFVRALRASKDGGSGLQHVPAIFWTANTWGPDFFLELTRFHWSAISFMPREEITAEIAREAVSQAAGALQSVPVHLRTRELCAVATGRDICTLVNVPIEFAEGLLEAWLHCADKSDWNRIPERFRTEEFTFRALGVNPLIIEEIPMKFHTQAICNAFLRGGTHATYLEDVNPEARSRILCIACLKENRGPLDAVPRLLWGPDIIEADRIGQMQTEATLES